MGIVRLVCPKGGDRHHVLEATDAGNHHPLKWGLACARCGAEMVEDKPEPKKRRR